MAIGTINIPNVAALECPEGKDREILWDDGLRGFGIVAFHLFDDLRFVFGQFSPVD